MDTLIKLALNFKALGGMDEVWVEPVPAATLEAYTALVDAVEDYPDHTWACAIARAILGSFDY